MLFIILTVLVFIFWDVCGLLLGLILIRFNRLHRFALRLLSMSLLYPKKLIPSRCCLDCEVADCRNWTCSSYHRSRKK